MRQVDYKFGRWDESCCDERSIIPIDAETGEELENVVAVDLREAMGKPRMLVVTFAVPAQKPVEKR